MKIDAIVASNDSTAGGAIAALKAEDLSGKVAVSGQDAELAACQRVVEGTQTLTVYKPVRKLAETAAEVAVLATLVITAWWLADHPFLLPVLAAFVLMQKHFERGLFAGSTH